MSSYDKAAGLAVPEAELQQRWVSAAEWRTLEHLRQPMPIHRVDLGAKPGRHRCIACSPARTAGHSLSMMEK